MPFSQVLITDGLTVLNSFLSSLLTHFNSTYDIIWTVDRRGANARRGIGSRWHAPTACTVTFVPLTVGWTTCTYVVPEIESQLLWFLQIVSYQERYEIAHHGRVSKVINSHCNLLSFLIYCRADFALIGLAVMVGARFVCRSC